MGTLPLTGERTVPGVPQENYYFRRHEVVYAACPHWYAAVAGPGTQDGSPRAAPATVLDAGSGEGYGGTLLAAAAPSATVLGVDYDASTVGHAAVAHAGPRTAYLRGAVTALPVADRTCDLAVSLQVLEHIWSPADLLAELVRVTRPGGVIVLSTPNRLTFSPGLGRRERPANPFHCREYDPAELVAELARWAPRCHLALLLGVHHGSRLRRWEAQYGPVVRGQQAASPDRWPDELAALVAAVESVDFDVGTEDLERSLDLVAVLVTPSAPSRAPDVV